MPDTPNRRITLVRRALPYIALAILAVLVHVRVYPPDSAYYYSYTHSLLYDMDLSFFNQIDAFPFQPYEVYIGPMDLPANDWPAGTGILWIATVAWTGLGQLLSSAAGLTDAPTGLEESSMLAAMLGGSLAGLLALWIPFRLRIFAGGLSNTHLWLLAAAMIAGTPYGYYLTVYPATSHIPSAALAACALGAWQRWTRGEGTGDAAHRRDRMAWAVLAGVSMGLLAVIRPQNVVFGIIPVLDLALNRREGVRVRLAELAAALGMAFIAMLPLTIVWHTLYGSWLALPKIEEMHWFRPTIAPFLFSSYHGYLSWAPLCLFCIAGLALRRQTWPLLAGVLAQLYVNACNEWWWAGGSFSNRRMVGCTPFLLIGLWSLFTWVKERKHSRRLFVGLTAVCVLCCLWTSSLLLTEVGRKIRLDYCQYWPHIVKQIPAGIIAGIANIAPWHEIKEHAWARLLVPLWIGTGIAAIQAIMYMTKKYRPRWNRISMAAGLACAAAFAVCLWFGIAAARTAPDPDRAADGVRYSRFRWIYRYEEAHMAVAYHEPWDSVDAMLAAERIFNGYYQPWRMTGFSLLDRDHSYMAYFAFKEAIIRGDHTNSRPLFMKLLEQLIETRDEKKVAWLNELGAMHGTQKEYRQARLAIEKALAIDPGYAQALENQKKLRWELSGADSGLKEEDIQKTWSWE